MNPTSVDIKDILVAEGGFAFGTDLFIGTQPPTPLNCVTLFDTTTSPPDGTIDGNNVFFQEGLMVWVRNESYEAAFLQAQGIISLLHNRAGFTQNETFYLYCNLQSGPNALGEGDDEEGTILTLNFNLQRKSGIVPAGDFLTFAKLVHALVAGTGITLTVDETNQTITFVSAGGGGTWGGITGTLSNQSDLQSALNLKVDKVTGKGLSTEDYTTAEKSKLSGIEAGAEVNVNADWNASSGDAQILNKPTLATVATSGSYNDLSGTPTFKTINSETITGTGNIEISGGLDKTFQTLTEDATITFDAATSVNGSVTLTASRIGGNITNAVVGEVHCWKIIQGGAGGYTMTWGNQYKFGGGITPILSATVGAVDLLFFLAVSATEFHFINANFDVKTP